MKSVTFLCDDRHIVSDSGDGTVWVCVRATTEREPEATYSQWEIQAYLLSVTS